jgi:ArsR family transcriptional regulator
MAANTQLLTLEQLLKALADRTRLRIVGLLVAGEICVCHIHKSLGIPQPTASRHLAYLRKTGLVHGRRQGLWVHYRLARLDDPVMQAVLESVAHAVGHLGSSERDLRRLASKVELNRNDRLIPVTTGCCAPSKPPAALV